MLGKSRWLGLALTVVFLGLAFSRVDLGELADALRQANYLLVLPAALATLAGYLLRTARWQLILAGAVPAGFGMLFSVLMIGFATNNVLPARLGEFVRAVLLRQRTGLRKTFSLATIFVERLLDGLVLVGILAALSLFLKLPGWGQQVQLLSSALFAGVTAGVLLLLGRQQFARRLLSWAARPLGSRAGSWLDEAFGAFLLGLRPMRAPRTLGLSFGISIGIWLLEGLSYYLLSYAFDFPLQGTVRIVACGLLLVVVNLGIMIPSAPGYVGTFQFFALAALAVFGVPPAMALGLALISHAMQYVLVTAIGACFVARAHLVWSALAESREADEPAPDLAASGGARE